MSGFDRRRGEPYMLEVFSGTAGGPAGPHSDGWLTLLGPGAGGVLYIDSAEVIEQKYPYVLWEKPLPAGFTHCYPRYQPLARPPPGRSEQCFGGFGRPGLTG